MKINKNNDMLTLAEALESALTQAELNSEYLRLMDSRLEDGLYMLELRSDWMWYELYVNAANGALLGFNSEPSIDVHADTGVSCTEILDENSSDFAA